jgi:glutamate-1-semialdehyde 2,1-aminomutase
MPTAVWGLSPATAKRYRGQCQPPPGRSGMGTTLSANPMQFACLVATLSEVMTARKTMPIWKSCAERLSHG